MCLAGRHSFHGHLVDLDDYVAGLQPAQLRAVALREHGDEQLAVLVGPQRKAHGAVAVWKELEIKIQIFLRYISKI